MYTYSQHGLLKPQRVARVRLLAFSLGHADLLCGVESPLYSGKSPSPAELALAFFICSRPWEKALRQIRDGSGRGALRRMKRRFWRMKPERFDATKDLFLEYLALYSLAPPRWEDPEEKGTARAPWQLSVFMAIQEKTNLTADETWGLTTARAFELAAVIGANQGDDKLVSLAEMSLYDRMMAADVPAAN